MDSTLVQVLKRSNLRGQVITYDETRRWPVSEYKVVFQVGILRRIEDAKTVVCTDCGDPHEEEVICHVGSEPRIHCPALGLIQVRPERLQRWEVDFESLGRLLAAELKLTADIQTITPGRIWLLGRRTVVDRKAELFLVCGAGWPDNLALLRGATRLQSSPAPIILCPDRLPGEPEWRDAGRSLFRLSEWMRLEDGRLSIDFDGFADLWHQTAGASERPLDPTPVAERRTPAASKTSASGLLWTVPT
jgi:hypothetical protein